MIILLLNIVAAEYRVPETYTDVHISVFEEGVKKYAPKLQVQSCTKGRCAIAREAIEAESEIILLPLEETITSLDPSPLPVEDGSLAENMMMNILYRKFVDTRPSFINSAIHLFPVSIDIPLNWTSDKFDIFRETTLWRLPLKRETSYIKYYKRFYDAYSKHKDKLPLDLFEIEAWKWASMIIQTRTFSVQLYNMQNAGMYEEIENNPSEQFATVYPLIDSLNHDCYNFGDKKSVKMFRYLNDPPRVQYVAFRDYAAYHEVFNFYGQYPSHSLLGEYGFVIPTNFFDTLMMTITGQLTCRETVKDGTCEYNLGLTSVNMNMFLSLIEPSEPNPSFKLQKQLENLFTGNRDASSFTPEEFELVINGHISYRKILAQVYKDENAASYRELRRKYLGSRDERYLDILQLAENQRKSYFYVLKLIDKSGLNTVATFLFG